MIVVLIWSQGSGSIWNCLVVICVVIRDPQEHLTAVKVCFSVSDLLLQLVSLPGAWNLHCVGSSVPGLSWKKCNCLKIRVNKGSNIVIYQLLVSADPEYWSDTWQTCPTFRIFALHKLLYKKTTSPETAVALKINSKAKCDWISTRYIKTSRFDIGLKV